MMARKQDTRTSPPKAAAKSARAPGNAKGSSASTKTSAQAEAKSSKARALKTPASKTRASKTAVAEIVRSAPRSAKIAKSVLEAVRTPVAAVAAKMPTGKVARDKSAKPSKGAAKRVSKTTKDKLLSFVPELPHLPAQSQVGDVVKSIGTQIVGAINTDVGRVMVAELLMYVAKSLTKAAAGSESAETAKSAILGAGAKIGAAAAEAGGKMVSEGRSAAAVGAGAAGEAAETARGLMREVAQVAVGAVGGVVADVATKAMGKRRSAADAKASSAAASAGDGAPTISANAGHRPPKI